MHILPTALLTALLAPAMAGFTDEASALGVDTPGSKSGASIWLDFNNDGWLDILAQSDRGVFLYQADGAGGFSDVSSTLASTLRQSVVGTGLAAGDLNHDGWVDLVRGTAESVGASHVSIYLNGGPDAPGFPEGGATQTFSNSYGYVFGVGLLDYTGDGWLDIVAGQSSGGTFTYANRADGRGQLSVDQWFYGSYSDYLAVGDVNADGLLDVVTRATAYADILVGDGAGGLTTASDLGYDFNTQSGYPGGVALCDLNEDGYVDIVRGSGGQTSSQYHSAEVFLYDASALGFASSGQLAAQDYGDIDGLACGDFDNDGDTDLYLSGLSGGLLENTWSSTRDFRYNGTLAALLGSSLNQDSAVFADFDHDGDLDLLVAQNDHSALLVNSGESPRSLEVSFKVDLDAAEGGCAGETLRDDIGARVYLQDANDLAIIAGARFLGVTRGFGAQEPPSVHFGLADHDGDVKLRYVFAHPNAPDDYHLVVPRALLGEVIRLQLTTNDLDGDGISNAHEGYGYDIDTDGDGYRDWEDLDADGDGLLDADERGDDDLCTDPAEVDSDGDRIPDWRDDEDGRPDTGGSDSGGSDSGGSDSGGSDSGGSDSGGSDSGSVGDSGAPTGDSGVPTSDSGAPSSRAGLVGGRASCGCAGGGRGAGGGLGLLLGLVALRRRRHRGHGDSPRR